MRRTKKPEGVGGLAGMFFVFVDNTNGPKSDSDWEPILQLTREDPERPGYWEYLVGCRGTDLAETGWRVVFEPGKAPYAKDGNFGYATRAGDYAVRVTTGDEHAKLTTWPSPYLTPEMLADGLAVWQKEDA